MINNSNKVRFIHKWVGVVTGNSVVGIVVITVVIRGVDVVSFRVVVVVVIAVVVFGVDTVEVFVVEDNVVDVPDEVGVVVGLVLEV